jgi:hypothetical protein
MKSSSFMGGLVMSNKDVDKVKNSLPWGLVLLWRSQRNSRAPGW